MSSICPVVLVVYFSSHPDVPRYHFYVTTSKYPTTLFDLPLWIPSREDLKERQILPPPPPKEYIAAPIFRWSTDYVSCGDERWTVFGPFDTQLHAVSEMEAHIPPRCIRGYRVVNQHCYQDLLPVVRESWTDG